MRFKILYSLFFIVSIMFSRFMLWGPISLRHVLTIAMFVYCIVIGEFKIDRFIKWYLVFLVFYTLSNIITGYTTEVVMKLFGTFFSAIVLYMATKVMIQKYDGLNWIIFTLLAIAVIDSVVTIGQFYNNPIAKTISEFIYGDDFNEELYEYYERRVDLHGRSAAGLMGAVANGYFLSAACILSLYNKKGETNVVNWILFVVLSFALFLVQERSGLFIGIFCALVYLYLISARNKKNSVIILLFIPIIIFLIGRFGSSLVSWEDTRYATHALDNGGRDVLAQNAWNYVRQNPMGGIMEFHSLGNRDSHNLFINSFVYGGIIGGLVMIGIIAFQLIFVGRILFKSLLYKSYSLLMVVFSLVYFDYTANSFFHNASIVSGTALFFVFWGIVTALREGCGLHNNVSKSSLN